MTDTPTREELEARVLELERSNSRLQEEIAGLQERLRQRAVSRAGRPREGAAGAGEPQRLQQILDSFPFGIYIVDRRFRMEYVNRPLRRDFGDPGRLKCHEYFHGLPEPCSWCRNDKVFQGEIVRWEWHSKKTGRYYDLIDIPLENEDGTLSKLEVFNDITERKGVESALEESRRRLMTLLSNLPGMAYRCKNDPQWTMEFVSSGCDALTGYHPEELVANARLSYADLILPEDRSRVWETIQEALGKGEAFQLSYRILTGQGEEKWVWEQGRGVFETGRQAAALEGFITDVTERMQAEEQLRERNHFIQTILDNLPIGLAVNFIDEGKAAYMNRKFEEIYGWPEEELVSIDAFFEKVYPDPAYRKKIKQRIFDDIGSGDVDKMAWEGIEATGKDGRKRTVSAKNIPISEQNFMISTVQDITESKTLADRLQQAQKMEAVGNLAGGIAHDFNNVLASIIGFTELAMDEKKENAALDEYLGEILSAGKRAKELVKQILTFARQSDEERKPIRVDSIAREALKFLRSSIPATIEIRQAIESRSLIMGNSTQVYQILMNLCTNAAQAMEADGGVLEVRLEDVAFDRRRTVDGSELAPGTYLKLTVSDTGVGIPPGIIDSVFEPYFTTKGLGEGTGMGLAIVYGIVESYGGKIQVESTPKKGTRFTILLPTTRKNGEMQHPGPEPLPTGTERILFVDDEPSITTIAGQILDHLGYEVTTESSSTRALERFRAEPDRFDLVITDMTMPEMTGDRLAAELLDIRPELPVILCTGYSGRVSGEAATRLGIRALASKPISRTDLANLVRRVLDEAKPPA